MKEVEDCPHCGKCPICGEQNNHYHHKYPPWSKFQCHPFYSGDGKELTEEKLESGLKEIEKIGNKT